MRGILSIQRLRYFLEIAEQGSISAAARTLNVAQPALSYHIAELERLSGLALFSRSNDGVILTEPGRVLRRHAIEIVRKTNVAEDALGALSRSAAPAPRLRIAVITSLAAALTPLLVKRVAAENEKVTLGIVEAGTREIVTKLEKGQIDMAISLDAPNRESAVPIAMEKLWFLAPAGAGHDDIALADVARHPLVLPAPGNPLRELIDQVFDELGLSMNVILEVDGQHSRQNAVASGIGSTILGAHSVPAASPDESSPVVRKIVAPDLYRPIFIGFRRGLDEVLATRMTGILKSALLDLGLSPTASS